MDKVPENTNHGTPMQGGLCGFPGFGNVGAPLMATLSLPGFTIGLPVWLFFSPVVLNAPNASQTSNLYQEHKNNQDPLPSSSVTSASSLSTSFGEKIAPSSRSSKRNRRKKNKRHMKKQGGTQLTADSHVGCMKSTTTDHARGKISTTENKVGGKRERGKVKLPCKLCTGNHLTHHCNRMDEALQLLKESEDSHQQILLTSPESFSEQPLVDEVVEPTPLSVDPTFPSESELNTTQIFYTTRSKLSEHGGIPLASSVLPPSYGIISFDLNGFT